MISHPAILEIKNHDSESWEYGRFSIFSYILESSKFSVISMATFVIKKKYVILKIRGIKHLKCAMVDETCFPGQAWPEGIAGCFARASWIQRAIGVLKRGLRGHLVNPLCVPVNVQRTYQPEAVSYFFKIDTWKALLPAERSQRYGCF